MWANQFIDLFGKSVVSHIGGPTKNVGFLCKFKPLQTGFPKSPQHKTHQLETPGDKQEPAPQRIFNM